MEAYALTDIGWVRTMSQDYIYSPPEKVGSPPSLFLMAGNIDDHRAGDYVSRFAVENLVIYINGVRDGSSVVQSKRGIKAVNGMLYGESLRRGGLKGMGCTLAAGVVEDNTPYVANVGGSRLYLAHGNSIRQITGDRSYAKEVVAIGQMKRESEDCSRYRNIITRAPGIDREVKPDFLEADLGEGDHILFCSDNLSSMLEDQSMYDITTGERNLKKKAALLIETANRRGGVDNIAVVLVNSSGREAGVC